VGGVVGGIAIVSIVVGVLYWMRRRSRTAKSRSMDAVSEPPPGYYSSRSSMHLQGSAGLGGMEVKEIKVDEKPVGDWHAEKMS